MFTSFFFISYPKSPKATREIDGKKTGKTRKIYGKKLLPPESANKLWLKTLRARKSCSIQIILEN